MNKYELALVVSAKIEDDARTATVEKAKEYITRAGGTVTEVEENRDFYTKITSMPKLPLKNMD
mgnify:CR=1 FL=1